MPRTANSGSPFSPVPLVQKPLTGGLNVSLSPTEIGDTESPDCLNVDFNNGGIETSRGMRKFGNRVAPSSGLRFRVSKSFAPLPIDSTKSVPLRGYGMLPYSEDYDIGGSFDFEGTFPATDVFHVRRGRDFQLDVSFRLPVDERLFEQDSKGAGAPGTPDPVYNPFHGFDEALDECFCIIQKGGERTAQMSWALAVVNIGKCALGDASGVTAPAHRVSNYALCWIWLDMAQVAESVPFSMRYALASGVTPGVAGTFCTQAFRAFIVHKFIEPGVDYHVSLQAHLDTGSQGGNATATAWNNDGYVKCWVSEGDSEAELVGSFVDSGAGGTTTGMDVWKGPTDSIRYFSKYGVRFAGRDAMYWGLGMRFLPWQTCGFIPFGADAAPLENGGWRMIDRSASTVAQIYGGGVHTLTGFKNANADAFLRVNHAGFSSGNTNGGIEPTALHNGAVYGLWNGLGSGATPNFNAEALRGYRLVTTGDFNFGAPNSKGAIFSILSYAEVAGNHEVTILGGSSINAFGAVGNQRPLLIQAFRWHQRDIESGELRIWSAPRDYEASDLALRHRRRMSIRRTVDLADASEPDRQNLIACWRADDGGGQVVRELVVGGRRNGFLAPFGMGVSTGGTRGGKQVYLSGEGEALILDLSENPVAKRELENMLRGTSQGFAVEITCVFPHAFYPIMSPTTAELLPDSLLNGNRPRFVPDIVSWDVKEPSSSGLATSPKPILSLTHRGLRADNANGAQFARPAGFSAEVAVKSDQENVGPIVHSDLLPWFLSGGVNVSRYDQNAGWVGKTVTIQVGVQTTGTPNTYDVYVAMHPKQDFLLGTADPGDAEFAYVTTGGGTYDFSGTYYQASTIRIEPRDVARSIITIGGRWNPSGLGYTELNCPMILDEVRIFGTAAPGALPSTNGGVVTGRNGKLEGLRCLPPRLLAREEILEPVGPGLELASVTQGSRTVSPGGTGRFFTGAAQDTRESLATAYLMPEGDEFDVPAPETIGTKQTEFYRVASVASDGSSATLDGPVNDATRRSSGVAAFRLIGYTAFEDALETKPLPVAGGKAYVPGTSTTADALVTEPLFDNLAPVSVPFRARIYGPGAVDVLPTWVRGLVSPRRSGARDGILGVSSVADRIFAGVQGALYEADDRWREDDFGPCLLFRSMPRPPAVDLSFPLQDDRVRFAVDEGAIYQPDPTHAKVERFDAYVTPDECGAYQTIMWVGSERGDPQKAASTSLVHLILRLNRGRPEFVLGSSATTSSGAPEKGLFIATANATLPPGVRSQVRVLLATRSSGGTSVLKKPYIFINGRLVRSSVNAVESHASITAATDWMRTSTIVQPGTFGVVVLGAARDGYRAPEADASLALRTLQMRPQRLCGWLHGLCGRLSDVRRSTAAVFTGTNPPNFDAWEGLGDDDIDLTFHVEHSEGVGHHVWDSAGGQYGVILSHPFISLFHEFGRSDDMISWARYGQQLYAVNGERVALLNVDRGSHAGVLPPGSAPTFALERFPLWKPNARGTTGTNPDNDPVVQAAAGAAQEINHLRSVGNNYLLQTLAGADATAMAWLQRVFFHFKTYWKPQSVAGRISLWRRGGPRASGGPFIECRDGFLWVGWYDVYLKREVALRTSGPVFKPGVLHYINLRKLWPSGDVVNGNLLPSFYSDGRIRRVTFSAAVGTFQVGESVSWPAVAASAGIVTRVYGAGALQVELVVTTGNAPTVGQALLGNVSGATGTAAASYRPMRDVAIVRQFRRSAPTNAKDDALDAFVSATALADNWSRNLVSFTDVPGPAGCTATGMVSAPGAVFTGAPVGVVNTGVVANAALGAQQWGQAAAPNRFFHPDMTGMLFQFATGAFAGKVYRIITVTNGQQISVVELDGTVPDLTGPINVAGGVFAGIALVKGEQFDQSRLPDAATYDVEFMGTSLQASPLDGFAPHEGEAWTPGWGMTATNANGEDARCFENIDTTNATGGNNEPLAIGTDKFPAQNYDSTGEPGPLRFDNNRQFYCTDGQVYTGGGWASSITTQPNTGLVVAKDPHTTNTAPTCTAASPGAGEPEWNYNQTPATWAGERYFAVAFFDTDQGVLSNPSPVLRVVPSGEDAQNPSGALRALLRALPVARDRGAFEVWIFCGLANGNSTTLFRVARVPNMTAEAAVLATEEKIGDGLPLEFDNGEPPECRVIAVSNGRLFAAALTALQQLDAIVPSKPLLPAQFRYTDQTRLNVGAGDPITGLVELDGLLLAMKREGVFSITLSTAGTVEAKILTEGAGCVAHQSVVEIDHQAIWRSDRGLAVAERSGSASDLAQVAWLSGKLDILFREQLDPAAADRSSGAVNRLRDQYVLTVKSLESPVVDERLSAMGQVFSRYRDPGITALASVRDPGGGAQRLVGGTREGFLVWMDREDTQLLEMGTTEAESGSSSIFVGASGSTTLAVTVASGFVDQDLEGLRGTVVRWQGAGGEQRATVLGCDGGILHLDRPVESADVAVVAAVATVGAQVHSWLSKVIDFGAPDDQKRLSYLGVELEEGGEGRIRFEFYLNRQPARRGLKENLPVDGNWLQLAPPGLLGKHFQVRISSEPLTAGGRWKVTGLAWKVQPSEQTQ